MKTYIALCGYTTLIDNEFVKNTHYIINADTPQQAFETALNTIDEYQTDFNKKKDLVDYIDGFPSALYELATGVELSSNL